MSAPLPHSSTTSPGFASRNRNLIASRRSESRRQYLTGRAAETDAIANMANAALTLYSITADEKYIARAEAWVKVANALYWDEDDGGYFFTATDGEGLIVRTKTANDAAAGAFA